MRDHRLRFRIRKTRSFSNDVPQVTAKFRSRPLGVPPWYTRRSCPLVLRGLPGRAPSPYEFPHHHHTHTPSLFEDDGQNRPRRLKTRSVSQKPRKSKKMYSPAAVKNKKAERDAVAFVDQLVADAGGLRDHIRSLQQRCEVSTGKRTRSEGGGHENLHRVPCVGLDEARPERVL